MAPFPAVQTSLPLRPFNSRANPLLIVLDVNKAVNCQRVAKRPVKLLAHSVCITVRPVQVLRSSHLIFIFAFTEVCLDHRRGTRASCSGL